MFPELSSAISFRFLEILESINRISDINLIQYSKLRFLILNRRLD